MDVTSSDYFYEPVLWALQNKITTGLDANHFAPSKALSRQELADYLCVDRSALARELTKMRSEGLIDYDKNCFRILEQ